MRDRQNGPITEQMKGPITEQRTSLRPQPPAVQAGLKVVNIDAPTRRANHSEVTTGSDVDSLGSRNRKSHDADREQWEELSRCGVWRRSCSNKLQVSEHLNAASVITSIYSQFNTLVINSLILI